MEIEGLPLQPDLSYIEHPVKILDEKERVTRNKVMKFYKSPVVKPFRGRSNLGAGELYSGALSPSSPRCVEVTVYVKSLILPFSYTRHSHEISG